MIDSKVKLCEYIRADQMSLGMGGGKLFTKIQMIFCSIYMEV